MEIIGYTAAIRMPVLQCHHVVSTGVATAHTNRYETFRRNRFLPYSPTILNPSKICEKTKQKHCFQKKSVQCSASQYHLLSKFPKYRRGEFSSIPPGAPLRQPFFPRIPSRRPSKEYPSDPSLLVMQTGLSSTNPELRYYP